MGSLCYPSLDELTLLVLTRDPPLSIVEHQEVAFIAALTALQSRDFSLAQSFLQDALRQAQALGAQTAIERCLYWKAVISYFQSDYQSCQSICESLLSSPDLTLDLVANVSLLLSNTTPLLLLSSPPRLPVHPALSAAFTLLPDSARESGISRPTLQELAHDHLRRARTAFALTYVGRLAEAMAASPSDGRKPLRASAAFANVAAHFEFRQEFRAAYARVATGGLPDRPDQPSQPQSSSLASVLGRKTSTTRALLASGKTALLGRVSANVVETEGTVADRLRFWAIKARGAEDEVGRFAAARQLALVADEVHDFRLLEEAVRLASEFSGPQSGFYKELQEILGQFRDRKSEIFFLPANPPGVEKSGPSTPTEAARRASRVSTGGMPVLSSLRPIHTKTDLSP